MNDKKRGGPGRRQGRKSVGEDGTITMSIRLTPEQREKIKKLGGAKWIRAKIDEASA